MGRANLFGLCLVGRFEEGLGGKSEHQRARCRVTQVRSSEIYAGGKLKGLPTDSATENRQPSSSLSCWMRDGRRAEQV